MEFFNHRFLSVGFVDSLRTFFLHFETVYHVS